MRARDVLLTLAILGVACSPAEEVTRVDLQLDLPVSLECRPPAGAGRLEIVAAGDFPSTNDTVEVRSVPQTMAMPIRKFPFETRVLSVSLRIEDSPFIAGALHRRVEQDVEATLLLLPIGRSCATPDAQASLTPGAALAPLPGGGFVIVGGLDEDSGARAGFRRLSLVPVDEGIANLDVELATRRIGASATLSGTRVLIAGGAEFEGQNAVETYEVYDAATGVLDPPQPMCTGVCQRRDHGATALADGRVLLVGGVSISGGTPTNTAVAIDPVTHVLDESFGVMQARRRQPFVGTLDDGTVVVAGGFDESGALVASVESVDPAEGVFRVVGGGLPDRPDAAFVVLPGGRLVMIGGRGDREDRVTVFRFAGGIEPRTTDLGIRGLVPLSNARAVALADHRLLVVGTDDAGESRAFRVDVGRGLAEERGSPARPTSALVGCEDGAIAEIGAVGTSYRRELLRTTYDNPPDTLFAEDAEWLGLDVATAYTGGLEAVEDLAPVRIASLEFADVRVTPTIDGPYRLVFESDQGVARTVVVGDTVVSVDGCEIARGDRDTITFSRRGAFLDVESDAATGQCPLSDLEGRVRLSVRLASGSRFRAVAVARL